MEQPLSATKGREHRRRLWPSQGALRRIDRYSVINTLKSHQVELQRLAVRHAALFGSRAPGETSLGSDIDLMVEIDPDARIGLFEYAGIVQHLESLFSVSVDVANRAKLKPLVRPFAERDAIYAL